ncbi:hypothetical protein PMAYCL1PPCAC_00035, partial [Pristionchus mayeri]
GSRHHRRSLAGLCPAQCSSRPSRCGQTRPEPLLRGADPGGRLLFGRLSATGAAQEEIGPPPTLPLLQLSMECWTDSAVHLVHDSNGARHGPREADHEPAGTFSTSSSARESLPESWSTAGGNGQSMAGHSAARCARCAHHNRLLVHSRDLPNVPGFRVRRREGGKSADSAHLIVDLRFISTPELSHVLMPFESLARVELLIFDLDFEVEIVSDEGNNKCIVRIHFPLYHKYDLPIPVGTVIHSFQ